MAKRGDSLNAFPTGGDPDDDEAEPGASSIDAKTSTEIASYIAQLTAEMAHMARRANLETLSYLLSMARVEAEMCAREDIRY